MSHNISQLLITHFGPTSIHSDIYNTIILEIIVLQILLKEIGYFKYFLIG